MSAGSGDWYTISRFGWYGPLNVTPPVGPWHGEDDALDALARWYRRAGADAGSAAAAMAIRVRGPYATRADAVAAAHYSGGV